jgi:hypothetical protein
LLRQVLVLGCFFAITLVCNLAQAQTTGPRPAPAIGWNFIAPAGVDPDDNDFVLRSAERLRATEPLVAAALLQARVSDSSEYPLTTEGAQTTRRALRRILAGSGPQRAEIERALPSIVRYGTPVAWQRIGRRLALLLAFQWPHATPNYLVLVEGSRVTAVPPSPDDMPLAFTPQPAQDVDGDGNPDLILQFHSMGASCCAHVLVVSMGARMRFMQLGGMRGGGIRLVRHPHVTAPLIEFVEEGPHDDFLWRMAGPGPADLWSWERVTPQGVRPAFGEMAIPLAGLGFDLPPDRAVADGLLGAMGQSGRDQAEASSIDYQIARLARAGHHAAVRVLLRRQSTERPQGAAEQPSPSAGMGDGISQQDLERLRGPQGISTFVPRGMENGLGSPPAGQITDQRLVRALAGNDAAVQALVARRPGMRLPVAPADWLVGWARVGGEPRPLVWLAACGPTERERGLLVFRADGTLRYDRRDVCVQNAWAVGNPGRSESPFLFFDEVERTRSGTRTVRRVLGPGSPRMTEIGSAIVHQRERFDLPGGEAVDLVRFDRLEVVQRSSRPAVRWLPVLETSPREARHEEATLRAALPQIARRFGLPAARAEVWLSVWAQSRHIETPLQPQYRASWGTLYGRIYCECEQVNLCPAMEEDDAEADEAMNREAEPESAASPDPASACPCAPRPLAITFPPRVLGVADGARQR